jgi:nitric oxide reductase activation protein
MKQTEMKGAITTTDKQLVVLENRLEELNLSDDDQEEARSADGKDEMLRQLEEERKALNASQKLLDDLLAKSQEEAVAKAAAGNQNNSTTITFGNQNSGFQSGIINGGVSGISFGGK